MKGKIRWKAFIAYLSSIGIYWVVFQLTSDWFVRCIAGIILFGGLSVIARYLKREDVH